MRTLHLISHPNVVVDPAVPVTRWPLSPLGRQRMSAGLAQPWVRRITAVYASTEQKALDGAAILAGHLGLSVQAVAELGENDRSSTGFLPPPAFEAMADAFFAQPEASVRGWERAVDAQARIVAAVQAIAQRDTSGGDIALVSHGAVGTLLHSWLSGRPIDRRWDQPANGGGNCYAFRLAPRWVSGEWQPFDAPLRPDAPA